MLEGRATDLAAGHPATPRIVPNFGPIGREVYVRTYRRNRPDGGPEEFHDTVHRVIGGNVGFVDPRFIEAGEVEDLLRLVANFDVVPAGRHWWATGVPGRAYVNNCYVSAWSKEDIALHCSYLFDMLMCGGGVGANYSDRYVRTLPAVGRPIQLHMVCRPDHDDYDQMEPILSAAYSHEWAGAVEVGDSRQGWVLALERVIRSHWNGGGELVLDLSNVRPGGMPLRTFGGTTSGPTPLAEALWEVNRLLNCRSRRQLSSLDWMQIDHACARAVVAGGVRRSSRMSIKSWKDDDIFEFISCKQQDGEHWTTNISVEIDDDFVAALNGSGEGEHARRVHDAVVAGMLTNGEPGYWNIDHARSSEPNPDDVYATNPCGEESLSPWDVCCLGHVNLATCSLPFTAADLDRFRLMARFLIRATFGDKTRDEEREVIERNRRIGVGIMGFHDWLAINGVSYTDSVSNVAVESSLRAAYEAVREAANAYAWQMRIPAPATVTTVAPTGTVALMAGVTPSIQPTYARRFLRRVRFSEDDPSLAAYEKSGCPIEDDSYAPRTKVVTFCCEDPIVERCRRSRGSDSVLEDQSEIAVERMLEVQMMVQAAYVDNGISFTINVPPVATGDEAWHARRTSVGKAIATRVQSLRGITMMVDGTREQAPYERIDQATYDAWTGPKQATSSETSCLNGSCGVGNEPRME